MGKRSSNDIEHLILENIPFLAWYKDRKGRYLMVNQAFSQSYGLQPEDIIGKTDFDLCPREKALEYQRSDNEILISGEQQFLEQVEDSTKGRVLFETYKSPVHDDQGRVIGISGISRNVSDSTWMEKTLREREEQFIALLQNSSDAISIINRKGRIIFESSEKNKISEFSKEELLNKRIFDTVHPDDVGDVKITFKAALANPGRQIKKEYRGLHKKKRWIYVESIFSNQIDN